MGLPMPEARAGWGVRSGAIVLAASLLTACSGGTWVDVVAPMSSADFEKIQKDPKAKEGFETFFARGTCSQAGKAYAGEMRYGKGGVQVKCK